jgi:hypothetical protein
MRTYKVRGLDVKSTEENNPLTKLDNLLKPCSSCGAQVGWKTFTYWHDFVCQECFEKQNAERLFCEDWMLFFAKKQGMFYFASHLYKEPSFDKTQAILVNFKEFDVERPEKNFVVEVAQRVAENVFEYEDPDEFERRARASASTYTKEILEAEYVLHVLTKRRDESE